MNYDALTEYEEINTGGIHKNSILAVWCQTYNHGNYIKYALDGFLNQRTDYPFFVIVYDDASTDDTTDIIREYAEKYPDLICAYLAKKNTYGNPARREIFQEIKNREFSGKYIALCEGDDCWIERNKLDLQINFLENHPDYSFCMHNSMRLNCLNNEFNAFNFYDHDMELGKLEIIIRTTRLATCSLVYRIIYESMPDIFYNTGIGDYPRLLYLITKGRGYYFDKIMSVYRYATTHSWTIKQEASLEHQIIHLFKMSTLLKGYNRYTDGLYKEEISYALNRRVYGLLYLFENSENIRNDGIDLLEDMYAKYLNEVIPKQEVFRLINQRRFEGHCSDFVRDNIENYDHIVIWGTGDGGERITTQLYNDGIDFDGFLVDDITNTRTRFHDKYVYKMNEYPHSKENTLVIVSIYMAIFPQNAKKTLVNNGYTNFIFPFVININLD